MRTRIQKNAVVAGLLALLMLMAGCTMSEYTPVSRVDTGYSDADTYYYQSEEGASGAAGHHSASPSAAESKPKSKVEPSSKPAVPLAAPIAQ